MKRYSSNATSERGTQTGIDTATSVSKGKSRDYSNKAGYTTTLVASGRAGAVFDDSWVFRQKQ